jgi:hypothetical protein
VVATEIYIYTLIDCIILRNDMWYATVPWDSLYFTWSMRRYFQICFTIILHISPSRLHSWADIWVLVLIANNTERTIPDLVCPGRVSCSMHNTQKTSLEGKKLGVTRSYLLAILTVHCDPGLSLVASVLWLSAVCCPLSVVPRGTTWNLLFYCMHSVASLPLCLNMAYS